MGQDPCVGSPGGTGDIWHGCAMGTSPQANGTRMAALGRLRACPSFRLFPAVPGLFQGFVGLLDAVENSNSLFWEGWIKGKPR